MLAMFPVGDPKYTRYTISAPENASRPRFTRPASSGVLPVKLGKKLCFLTEEVEKRAVELLGVGGVDAVRTAFDQGQ
jgi:hypothetical protein